MGYRDRITEEFKDELARVDHAMIVECKAHGPYEGCFWEWNYWLANGTGTMFPLYVSGRIWTKLCSKFKTIDEALKEGIRTEQFLKWIEDDTWNQYTNFSLDETTAASIPYNIVNSIIISLKRLGASDESLPQISCDYCGEVIRGKVRFLGYGGNGGVGVELDLPCCESCFSSKMWCDSCCAVITPTAEGVCPNYDEADQDDEDETRYEEHELTDLDDEAERFELDGVVEADGGEGPPPVIVIWQKGA